MSKLVLANKYIQFNFKAYRKIAIKSRNAIQKKPSPKVKKNSFDFYYTPTQKSGFVNFKKKNIFILLVHELFLLKNNV